MYRKGGLIFILLLYALFTGSCRSNESETPPEQIDSYKEIRTTLEAELEPSLTRMIETIPLAGIAIGVVKGNEIIYAKGFGVKNTDTMEPVTPTSLFHMASVSKPFVATAIMQLVEQDEVDLDEPVVTYLPYFMLNDERYQFITVRQMLNHTSGMPDVYDYQWDQPAYDNEALERYVRSLTDRRLLFEPGSNFAYSNMAYEVLGDLIAKVSGQPFEVYVKDHILTPLEMHESTFFKQEVSPELGTAPHHRARVLDVYPYHRAHAPSSTLHSNVQEMANWAIANLNQGTFKGHQILSTSGHNLLWQPQRQLDDELAIGLSWFIRYHDNQAWIFHSGGDEGFRTLIALIPEAALAVIVLSNDEYTDTHFIADKIVDLVLQN